MYSSSYSQVNKFSPAAQKKMQYRSKGKSCGYYMRIIFFFSSLIQSLIIISLVLFLIYGKTQDSASSTRIQDLEKSFSQLSIENVALKAQRKNLTNILNATMTEKAKNDWDLNYLWDVTNKSLAMFQSYEIQLQQSQTDLNLCKLRSMSLQPCINPQQPGICNCGALVQQMKAGLELLESNLTQTKRIMTMEKDQIAKERDKLNLETIHLRRDKSTLEKELELSKQSTKDQFSQLLASVSTVSKSLLEKIDSLFPEHFRFQITCPKQKEHLEQIQTNCTSLSREVENKLQYYMNIVGDKVSNMQNENNHLKAENWRLSEDYRWCSQNRTSMMDEHKRNREDVQLKHDQEKEILLMDKMKLNGEIEILKNSVKYKNAEMDILREQYIHLNKSCMAKNGLGGYAGGTLGSRFGGSGSSYSSSSSSSLGQTRTGTAGLNPGFSSGLGFNGATSAGAGSSSSTFQQSGSRSGLTGVGSGVNKPPSTGGAFPNLGSYGSSLGSSGTGINKPESGRSSTGFGSAFGSSLNQGSSGTGMNKPDSGRSSASSGSSFGSLGSSLNQGSSGTGMNKPDSGRSSASSGSSFGSLGSSLNQGSSGTGINKPDSGRSSTSSGSLFGLLGSSLNQGSTGASLNKPTMGSKSSSGYGLGSSSTSSGTGASVGSSGSSKTPSSDLSWLGLGSSSSGQSKTGSVPGRASPGVGNSGTGSVFGGGKTNGLAGGPVIAQHIQELQRLINPPRPQEKQDLARILG